MTSWKLLPDAKKSLQRNIGEMYGMMMVNNG